ncbi:MAG TPA: type II secretion system protein GspH [Lentisphaeria bacterium]|nr:MAG: type II secretion system protein GspH [Lentisphaerae bacterium GWF2_50_93]HCE42727.1 type II secretion system protein GspH [Lentisphaeria bacterium]
MLNTWKSKKKTVRSGFTLIELIAVLAIALLITGVVVVNVGRMPAFISLDNTAHRIQYLFSKAAMMAAAQGKVVNVSYSGNSFTIDQADNSEAGIGLSAGGTAVSERIPESVELVFDDEEPKYIFFPDGTGSGTAFKMTLKGHSCRIRISPLTGAAVLEYPGEGEQ